MTPHAEVYLLRLGSCTPCTILQYFPTLPLFCSPPQYKIQLVQLEDDLLERLANAPDDILSDVPLIEGLEATKVQNAKTFLYFIL